MWVEVLNCEWVERLSCVWEFSDLAAWLHGLWQRHISCSRSVCREQELVQSAQELTDHRTEVGGEEVNQLRKNCVQIHMWEFNL